MLSSSARFSRRAFLSTSLSALALAGGVWPVLADAPPVEVRKWALLIGIDDYQDLGNLHAAVNDARALARTLKEVGGFTVQDSIRLLVSDATKDTDKPTRNNILTALATLSRQAKAGDTVYIMCFCHGIKDKNTEEAYILPSDTNANDEIESALAVRLFRRKLDAVKPRILVFTFDMCLTEPTRGTDPKPLEKAVLAQARGAEASGVGLAKAPAIEGAARFTTTLFGCSEGQSCWESKTEKRGYFSLYLEKGLRGEAADPRTGEVALNGLRDYVRKQVKNAVFTNHNAAQEPSWDDKSEGTIGPLVLSRVTPRTAVVGSKMALIPDIMNEAHNLLELVDDYNSLLAFAMAQARSGDVGEANETLKQAKQTAAAITKATDKSLAFRAVAEAQAKIGDVSGAKQTAALITVDVDKASTFGWIAAMQVEAGDLIGARETLNQAKQTAAAITEAIYKSLALRAIAEAQARSGDVSEANETLKQAKQTAAAITKAGPKASVLRSIAEEQVDVGDLTGARETLKQAKQTAATLTRAIDKFNTFRWIARTQAKAGDVSGAKQTAAAITEAYYKSSAFSWIAEEQAKAGDVSAARHTAATITETVDKSFAFRAVTEAQAKAGDVNGARETAAMITVAAEKSIALRAIAVAQAKAGDVNGARETAKTIKDAPKRLEALCEIVEAIVENEKAKNTAPNSKS